MFRVSAVTADFYRLTSSGSAALFIPPYIGPTTALCHQVYNSDGASRGATDRAGDTTVYHTYMIPGMWSKHENAHPRVSDIYSAAVVG